MIVQGMIREKEIIIDDIGNLALSQLWSEFTNAR